MLITEAVFFEGVEIYAGAYGCAVFGDDKALAPDMERLRENLSRFDVVLIEADGSACLPPLKGWRSDEPVIPPDFATKTIGVLDISVVAEVLSEGMVHRVELFTKITGKTFGDVFEVEDFGVLVSHPNGIFQNSDKQQKIIYCSKSEMEQAERYVSELRRLIDADIKLTAGSVINKTITEYLR